MNRARRDRGSVDVVRAGDERPEVSGPVVVVAVALAVMVAAAVVLVGARQLAARDHADVPGTLGAQAITLPGDEPRTVPGSAKLALLGPLVLLDSRGAGKLAPGASATVPLPTLPSGATAVLVEVSVLDATGPGAVKVATGAGEVVALRIPKAGAQLTTTTLARLGADGGLRVGTEGGGHVVVNLVGALAPAQTARAGRIVPVAAAEVLRLVPQSDGKDADIDVTVLPALRDAGPVSAVLVQVAADVGANGGKVAVGPTADKLDQTAYWSATAGADRTRFAFLVVPVVGPTIHLHYEAGSELRADIVGYVTDASAPDSAAGLVVPVAPNPLPPTTVPGGQNEDVTVAPFSGPAGPGTPVGVPTDRVAGALIGVAATGEPPGAVRVHSPAAPPPANATVTAPSGSSRAVVTVVATPGGAVRVATDACVSVTITPQAMILSE